MKKVIGKVWNPHRKTFQGVIGDEFSDSPGYYQFYEVGSNDHFRKRPEPYDELQEVSEDIFLQFYDQ